MKSTRLVQLALGVPDAIAPDRREAVAILLLKRVWHSAQTEQDMFDRMMGIASLYQQTLEEAARLIDAGELDDLLIADDDKLFDRRYPIRPNRNGQQVLISHVVRAIIAYSRAHPMLDVETVPQTSDDVWPTPPRH